jgi:N-glycosylase/DNA lyase
MREIEKQLIDSLQNKLNEGFTKIISDAFSYNICLRTWAEIIVKEKEAEIKDIMRQNLNNILNNSDFKQMLMEEMKRKIARSAISANDKIIDDLTANFKKDTAFQAKVATVIHELVDKEINKNK